MSSPSYDLVIFGATSFVGQILSRYLWQELGAQSEIKWCLAGRSIQKLEELRRSLGESAASLPLAVADAGNEDALRKLCGSARVVVSTVGPYALYGEPLIKACAELGTDYCDLTGEVQWIRRMVQRYETVSRQSGARVVNCCGFDSIPSDLGVHFVQREAMQRFGAPCARIKMRVKAMRGGFSGGTAASMMNVAKEAAADASLRKELADPYSICPAEFTPRVRQPEVTSAQFDADFNCWVAPFVMSGINTRIVHRTNALLDGAYGAGFAYDEAVLAGPGFKGRLAGVATSVGIVGFLLAAALPPSRAILQKFILPKPGEGPTPEAQRNGLFDLRFLGITANGERLRAKVTGDRDPGYGSTAKMLGQAALCLAQDVDKSARRGGFWTPAAIFGDRLIPRLTMRSGLSFDVETD